MLQTCVMEDTVLGAVANRASPPLVFSKLWSFIFKARFTQNASLVSLIICGNNLMATASAPKQRRDWGHSSSSYFFCLLSISHLWRARCCAKVCKLTSRPLINSCIVSIMSYRAVRFLCAFWFSSVVSSACPELLRAALTSLTSTVVPTVATTVLHFISSTCCTSVEFRSEASSELILGHTRQRLAERALGLQLCLAFVQESGVVVKLSCIVYRVQELYIYILIL